MGKAREHERAAGRLTGEKCFLERRWAPIRGIHSQAPLPNYGGGWLCPT